MTVAKPEPEPEPEPETDPDNAEAMISIPIRMPCQEPRKLLLSTPLSLRNSRFFSLHEMRLPRNVCSRDFYVSNTHLLKPTIVGTEGQCSAVPMTGAVRDCTGWAVLDINHRADLNCK